MRRWREQIGICLSRTDEVKQHNKDPREQSVTSVVYRQWLYSG